MHGYLELVIMLENKHYKKDNSLENWTQKLNVLRHLIRLAASTKYTRSAKPCLPMKKYEMMARYINEIGCMVGGYYKSLNGSTSGNGSAAK